MMFDDGPTDRRKDDKRWHLDKRLNIGHMVTTLAIVVSFFAALNDIQDQVVKNTAEGRHQREIIERVEKDTTRRGERQAHQLEQLNSKMDRLLENLINHK